MPSQKTKEDNANLTFNRKTTEDIVNDILEYYNKIKISYIEYNDIERNVLGEETENYDIEDALEILEEKGIIKYDKDSPCGKKYYEFYTNPNDIRQNILDINEKRKREEAEKEEEERQKEKKKREKDEKQKETNEKIISELRNNVENYIKSWEEEVRKINFEKENDIKQYIQNEENKLESSKYKTDQEKEERINEINNEIEKLEIENNKNLNEINSLGMLKFIKKYQLEMENEENRQKIIKYKEKIENLNENYNNKIQDLNKKSKDKISKYEKQIEDKYIYPLNPKEIISRIENLIFKKSEHPTRAQEQDFQAMKVIYEVMVAKTNPVTITELMANKDIRKIVRSDQKLSALCVMLKAENKIGGTKKDRR